MPDGLARLAFLADTQIGCMATFSGMDADDIERFAQRGMTVRGFPETTSLQWDVDRFRAALADINTVSPHLAVVGGDMIDSMEAPAQLEAFREVAATSAVPLHFAPGNHDICSDAAIPTAEAIDWYRKSFGPEHEVLGVDISDSARLTVITVNSAVLDQPRKVEGSFEAEMAWLAASLNARAAGPTIVVSHHPPFLESSDEGHNYWNIAPQRRLPFLDLLADSGVELLLCGHRHRNDSAHYRGVEIATSSAVGFPLGSDPPGYRMVEATESGITHTYYPLADPGWESIGGPPDA